MGPLDFFSIEPISLGQVLINFVIAVVLAFALRWHYIKFGRNLSNREGFAAIFPFIVVMTMLIITIVKSSLALSLGLVGALSIIRFRTPIKEPEELAYLYVCISLGIGLGANFAVSTSIVVISMMVIMGRFSVMRAKQLQQHLYLTIDLPERPKDSGFVDALTGVISDQASFCDIHRLDWRKSSLQVTYFIDISSAGGTTGLISAIRQQAPNAEIILLDQKRIPGV
jgi:hypothetical protein